MPEIQPVANRMDADINRFRAELEQARVGMEDMDQRLSELGEANEAMNTRLTSEVQQRRDAEKRIQELDGIISASKSADSVQQDLLRDQLSTTLEELQVMAEELELAREALLRGEAGTAAGASEADRAADAEAVRAWFHRLAEHVRVVDFAGAREIFAPDMIAFGTFTSFMTGRDAAEQQQWRNVWQHIDDFRFRDDIRALVSQDRLQAVGMAVFDSTGYREDGTEYARPGRATVAFVRAQPDKPWVAQHTHLSLFRDVPTRSFKNKPEKQR